MLEEHAHGPGGPTGDSHQQGDARPVLHYQMGFGGTNRRCPNAQQRTPRRARSNPEYSTPNLPRSRPRITAPATREVRGRYQLETSWVTSETILRTWGACRARSADQVHDERHRVPRGDADEDAHQQAHDHGT